jgi:hypothetical protein
MNSRTLFKSIALIFAMLITSAAAHAQEHDAPKVEVGIQFSSLSINLPDFRGTENIAGFGGRVTYNLNDYFAVEAEGNVFPTGTLADYVTGGAAQQMQFGAKVGKRWKHFGVFAKARPGFISFSRVAAVTGSETFTFDGETFTFPTFGEKRKNYFSMDLGGVLEFYPSRRIFTRFDLGDTIIRYGERDQIGFFFPSTPLKIPSEIRHNLQFTGGIGLRF